MSVLPIVLIALTASASVIIGSWVSIQLREGPFLKYQPFTLVDAFILPLRLLSVLSFVSFLSKWIYLDLVASGAFFALSMCLWKWFGTAEDESDEELEIIEDFSIGYIDNEHQLKQTSWIQIKVIKLLLVSVLVLPYAFGYSFFWGDKSSLTSICFAVLLVITFLDSILTHLPPLLGDQVNSAKFKTGAILLAFMNGHKDIIVVSLAKSFLIPLLFILFFLHSWHWVFNNIICIVLGTLAISAIQFEGIKTGLTANVITFVVLDVVAVFGSNWMLNAVKQISHLPVMIKVPENIMSSSSGFFGLGLGDVVIPGCFAALLLSYDKKYHPSGSHGPEFFLVGMIGYVLGIFTALVMAHTFSSIQPALLYINPLLILFVAMFALYKGELRQLMNFSIKPHSAEL